MFETMFSRSRNRKESDLCAIFVHAGAGYHSRENQKKHLQACSDAASLGMTALKAGGSALDAVELAIRVLEDREITNAGYGSNLARDGTVECDATIVDDLGRSGAVGAVCHIRNPISLARLVLRKSYQPLSLKRIPPNLLVGEGATEFAFENNMPVLPHDALVSPAARDRWIKWKEDLRNAAEFESDDPGNGPASSELDAVFNLDEQARKLNRRQHTRAMEGQGLMPANHPGSNNWQAVEIRSPSLCISNADSPRTPGSPRQDVDPMLDSPVGNRVRYESDKSPLVNGNDCTNVVLHQLPGSLTHTHIDQLLETPHSRNGHEEIILGLQGSPSSRMKVNGFGGHDGTENDPLLQSMDQEPDELSEYMQHSESHLSEYPSRGAFLNTVQTADEYQPFEDDIPSTRSTRGTDDHITDTVGAIAIDSYGRIAAGSSSGGIGMKFPGRVGPAALVGIGTAVIPEDPDDKDKVCVAAVTSGTGEHIAMTVAAATCADRLYHSVRSRGPGKMECVSEDEAIRSVIERDFMGHPSVKHSTAPGALGILAVKKTSDGIYIYFAHNTDSFAVASMHSDEDVPRCTMSRNKGNGSVAQGARSMKHRRHYHHH